MSCTITNYVPMSSSDYERLALQKEADQEVIRQRIYDAGIQATRLENGVRGLTDEVGELNALVKKWLEYGQPLDLGNLLEEVGDCLWRLSQIAKAGGFTLEQAMRANIEKLAKRYPEAYNDFLAMEENRDRKAEANAMLNEQGDIVPAPPKPEPCKCGKDKPCGDPPHATSVSEFNGKITDSFSNIGAKTGRTSSESPNHANISKANLADAVGTSYVNPKPLSTTPESIAARLAPHPYSPGCHCFTCTEYRLSK